MFYADFGARLKASKIQKENLPYSCDAQETKTFPAESLFPAQ